MSDRTRDPMLEVVDLRVRLRGDGGDVYAVNGVTFTLHAGEALALVGESGSGKSVTALAILGLLPQGRRVSGTVRYRGRDLLGLGEADLRAVRGREIAMIHQDPMTSLNPTLTVGNQLGLVLRHHLRMARRDAQRRSAELLDMVGIVDPRRRLGDYPHQFSGGQRQRILIAMALAADPSVIVADEPTTALDVTVQAEILELVNRLRSELGTAVLWITHDLGVVAGFADRVVVMYGGTVAESAPVDALYDGPRHPYTRGLLSSLPDPDDMRARLTPVPGLAATVLAPVTACPFATRCESADDVCRSSTPIPSGDGDGHDVACFHPIGAAR